MMSQTKTKREIRIVKQSDLSITIESVVNVPKDFVYRAHTDPTLIANWWGPAKYTNTIEQFDVRAGGKWRIIQTDKNSRHVFFGEFKELKPTDFITWTFSYEPEPGEVVETIRFQSLDGKRTKIHVTSNFPSKEARDGMLASGMESGYSESLDRLESIFG